MNDMNKNKGFTLIELLVVIAIIGILTSIILASMSSVKNRGSDKAVMSNLRNAMNQAEIVYNTRTANQNTYSDVCTNGIVDGVRGIGAMISAAAKASGLTTNPLYATNDIGTLTTATCNNSPTAWAAEVPLRETPNSMWCVDSLGRNKKTTTSMGANTSCL